MEPLDLGAPWLALKGAGHYESGCRPCHGGPDALIPAIAAAMTPLPPFLPPRIDEWAPEELFYIVKHGIKFTGMPAWRAQDRDDEVRAIVAFLLEIPDMDAQGYRELVYGAEPAGRAVVPLEDIPPPPRPPPGVVTTSCARCHGTDGLGRGSAAFPTLAGQSEAYLLASLQAYAGGQRRSGIMEPVAAGLTEEERRRVSAYFAALPPPAAGSEALPPHDGEADRARGRTIASRGVPERGVPSCMDCHGPAAGPLSPMYPLLSGQYADYLVLQLELFQGDRRGGSDFAHLMHHVVGGLSAQETRDVAWYYASLIPS
jgi:cytochrome c553/cytochrome c5